MCGRGRLYRGRGWAAMLAALACAPWSGAIAQPSAPAEQLTLEHVRFAHHGVQDGLSQVTVRAIAQDTRGFLWFGTQDGLNRFDGHDFQIFRHAAGDPGALPDNHVMSLAAGADGTLWVGTAAGGLGRYDPVSESFTSWRSKAGDGAALGGDNVSALHAAADGVLWVASGAGSLQLMRADGTLSPVPASALVDGGAVRCLRRGPDHGVFVCARRGLWLLSSRGEAVREYRDRDGSPFADADDVTWHGDTLDVGRVANGVARLHVDGTWQREWHSADGLRDDIVNGILADSRGRVWVAGQEGLSRIAEDGSVRGWRVSGERGRGAERAQTVFEDRDGLIWIGTWLDGISVFNPRTETFGELNFGALHADWRVPDAVTGVFVDHDGSLWLGAFDGGGLLHYDLARGVIEHVHAEPDRPGGFPSVLVQRMERDQRGDLWIPTSGAGLLRRAPDSNTYERFVHDADDPGSLPSNTLQAVLVARDGTLWVATWGAGVVSRCAGCREFRRYPIAGAGGEPPPDARNVNALAEDARGRIWVALRPGGVARIDPLTGAVTRWRGQPGVDGALSHDIGTAFAVDGEAMWIGTQGGGLNRAEQRPDGTWRFRNIGTREGLAADAIGGVVKGLDGKLWLSTTVGISSYDPENGRIENFGSRDGAQVAGYFIGASDRWRDGRIVFGGISGATIFDPREVEPRPPLHGVQITDFVTRLGARDRRSARALQVLDRHDGALRAALASGVDGFSVGFSALSFGDPEAVRYTYRLDGVDTGWTLTSAARRYASYGNLDPGEYRFRVRASRDGEQWGKETVLVVDVTPSLLASPLARVSYWTLALLAASFTLWQLRARLREQRRANRDVQAFQERLQLALWGTGDELWDLNIVTGELRRENPLAHLAGSIDTAVQNANDLRRHAHPDDMAAFDSALRSHLRGDTPTFDADYRVRDREGRWRWVRTKGKVVRRDEEGRALRLAGTTSDITEVKSHEIALERLNHELEDRVTDRTAELSAVNDSLRHTIEELRRTQHQLVESEKMAALGNLVAGIAHEINTPLGIGVTAASHLEQQSRRLGKLLEAPDVPRRELDAFQNAAQESARLILANLQRADKLVRSFKQVAVDQSSEQRRTVVLRTYLDEVMTSLYPALKKTRHVVRIDCPDDLAVDTWPGAIYQIVVNLVMNSLLHGFDGIERGHITLTVTRDGGHIVIDYRDDGRGMDETTRRRLFEPFFTTRRGHGGSGLGMHIAWNLATQVLRGTIACESEPGKGARFILRIPA